MEKTPKQDRDLERDRKSFIEAVSSVSIMEIPAKFEESTIIQLIEKLRSTKLFILGEMHGVKENVDVIYTIFKKFGFRQLALEWAPELKYVAEKFLESGTVDFDAIKDSLHESTYLLFQVKNTRIAFSIPSDSSLMEHFYD